MNAAAFYRLSIAKELAENSHVQDAFVIAVEQQAKERLERLSALRKIKPVDMTKLSQQVRWMDACMVTEELKMRRCCCHDKVSTVKSRVAIQ